MADDLTRRIRSSGKYQDLDVILVHRIASEAAQRCHSRTESLRYAKRKLYQAFGAFAVGSPAQAVTTMVAAVQHGQADLRLACLNAMRTHVSAAERVDWLEPVYEQVAEWCGKPSSVVDLACGLNPLAIPWMRLSPDASYWACEIDQKLVAAMVSLDEVMPVAFSATTCDLVSAPPMLSADVALMLKTVTTINQQDKDAASRVLAALDCRHIVLSMPRQSLSGRRSYSDDPDQILQQSMRGSHYRVTGQATFGGELIYHLTSEAAR